MKRVAGEWAWPLVRSALLVTPVLLLLSGLLMSADAAFSKRMSGALDAVTGVSFATRLGALLWVTLVALVSAGALSLALARRRSQAVVVTANTGLQLGATEAFSLLGSVTALLLFFDAISIECALATDRCALPDGMTYAQYVHHGFAELMIAAGLVLVMLLALARRVSLKTPLAERSMQVLSSTLVVATLPLVLSGVGRLQLYESVYGFTVARVLAQAATVLVGVLLVLRGATLWVARERFTFGVVLAGFATLSALNLLDVEGFVTKQNLEVAQQTGELDEYYLGQLSADSVVVRQPFFDTHPGSRVPVFPAGVRTCTDRSLQAWTLACQRVYWQF